MKILRAVSIVLGVFLVFMGFDCMFSPNLTFSTLAWIIGFTMLISAIGDLCTYSDKKMLGLANGWDLTGSILSLVFAIVLVFSNMMQNLVNTWVIYIVAIWLIVMGILRIISAIKLHSFRKELPDQLKGDRWLIALIAGIILIVAGVFGCIYPGAVASTIGILMSIFIIVSGLGMIANSLY